MGNNASDRQEGRGARGEARSAWMLVHYPDGDVGVYRVVADDPTAYPGKRECEVLGTHEQCAAWIARLETLA